MDWIADPQAWLALITLTALEIVLGIDNIIILSILVGRLPKGKRQSARMLGLGFAMVTRIALLLSIVWVIRLTKPLFHVFNVGISGRDIILIGGGLFLMAKSTLEIHHSFEAHDANSPPISLISNYWGIIFQIGLIDIIFSLDSVITAVGLANQVPIMIIAIVVSVVVMMVAAKSIGDFVDEHPTIKILALSFLILIGMALIGDGLDMHIPKGYLYFAMAFSVSVEIINIKLRKKLH